MNSTMFFIFIFFIIIFIKCLDTLVTNEIDNISKDKSEVSNKQEAGISNEPKQKPKEPNEKEEVKGELNEKEQLKEKDQLKEDKQQPEESKEKEGKINLNLINEDFKEIIPNIIPVLNSFQRIKSPTLIFDKKNKNKKTTPLFEEINKTYKGNIVKDPDSLSQIPLKIQKIDTLKESEASLLNISNEGSNKKMESNIKHPNKKIMIPYLKNKERFKKRKQSHLLKNKLRQKNVISSLQKRKRLNVMNK